MMILSICLLIFSGFCFQWASNLLFTAHLQEKRDMMIMMYIVSFVIFIAAIMCGGFGFKIGFM